jgi:hypothetical protein
VRNKNINNAIAGVSFALRKPFNLLLRGQNRLKRGDSSLPLMGGYEAGKSSVMLLQRDVVHGHNEVEKRNKPSFAGGRVLHDAQAAIS